MDLQTGTPAYERAVIVDLDELKGVLGFTKDGPVFTHLVRGAT